jgi:hypothetical protein
MKMYTENKLGNPAVEYGTQRCDCVKEDTHTDIVSSYAFTECFQTVTSYIFGIFLKWR